MIDIVITEIQRSGYHCDNKNCRHDPKYIFNIIGSVYHIKVGTLVAIISIGDNSKIYCRDCIEDVYNDIKSKLDPSLWAFK